MPRTSELREVSDYFEKVLWVMVHNIKRQCFEQIVFGINEDGVREKPLPEIFRINGKEISSNEAQDIYFRIIKFSLVLKERNRPAHSFWEQRKHHAMPYEGKEMRLLERDGKKFIPPSDEEIRSRIEELEEFLRSLEVIDNFPPRPEAVQKLMEGGA